MLSPLASNQRVEWVCRHGSKDLDKRSWLDTMTGMSWIYNSALKSCSLCAVVIRSVGDNLRQIPRSLVFSAGGYLPLPHTLSIFLPPLQRPALQALIPPLKILPYPSTQNTILLKTQCSYLLCKLETIESR